MIHKGDVIENPITGETMVFLQTTEDTGGDLLQIDLFVAPGGGVNGEHSHPGQTERLRVRRGEMTLEVDGRRTVLGPRDEAVIPPGASHIWWNSAGSELNAIVELSPAGRYTPVLSTFFGLARAGQVDEQGLPPLLQTSLTLREYRDTVVMTNISPAVRDYALPVLALVGRLLGLRPEYPYPRRSRVNQGMEIWRSEELTAA
ncbi:MAG TPA: cupin domain-containing protein [Longimicrobiaceae bacterium]|nr:cupin domain-containing protein [Longimicrobiaceae bacterium]